MVKHLAPYRTFVIRCWQEQCGQPGTCIYRFSLEIPATGERLGFTRTEDLIHALEGAIAQARTETEANLVEISLEKDSISHEAEP